MSAQVDAGHRGMVTTLDVALDYAAGWCWHVFPVHSIVAGECSCGNDACRDKGKHPRTKNGFKDATTDPAIIRKWWSQWPTANIGLRTGPESGIYVIDVDAGKGKTGRETLAALEVELGPLPATWTVTTGGGGEHRIYNYPAGGTWPGTQGAPDASGKIPDGVLGLHVDTRGLNGYVVAAPSNHASGNLYAWQVGRAPGEMAPANLPPAWLAKLTKKPKPIAPPPPTRPVTSNTDSTKIDEHKRKLARKQLAQDCAEIARMPADSGSRVAIRDLACIAGSRVTPGWLTYDDALAEMEQAARARGKSEEWLPTILGGLKKGMNGPPDYMDRVGLKIEQRTPTTMANPKAAPTSPPADTATRAYGFPVDDQAHDGGSHRPNSPTNEAGELHDNQPAPNARHTPISGPHEGEDFTELGMSSRFARAYGHIVKYTPALGFMVYDGQRWAQDEGKAQEVAKGMIRGIGREAKKAFELAGRLKGLSVELLANDAPQQEQSEAIKQYQAAKARAEGLAKATKDLSKRATVKAILGLASSDPRVAIDVGAFDRDEFLFNCDNGTINLKTGKLQDHNPRDMITKVSPVKYDQKATCPTWERFLSEIMAERAHIVTFLQLSIGYSLTGSTREQCFFILHGNGSNGKTVYSRTLRAIHGEYGSETPAETLMVKRNENAVPNDLARLAGVRYVGANETEDGQRLAEAKVKALTGDDPITARYLHKEFFEFQPEFKLCLRTNHKPVIKGTDDGIWRRIRLIPFEVQFTGDQQDKTLADRLLAELPGILAWAVRGCLEWQRLGNLAEPAEVLAAVAEYRQDSDMLGEFLAGLDSRKYLAKELYEAYSSWCEENGERHRLKTKAFGIRLTEAGWGSVSGTGNARYRIHPNLMTMKLELTVNCSEPFSQESINVENEDTWESSQENSYRQLTVNSPAPVFKGAV